MSKKSRWPLNVILISSVNCPVAIDELRVITKYKPIKMESLLNFGLGKLGLKSLPDL